jgi:preprotein translocase SecF subunit
MRLFENADYVFIPNRTKGYIFSGILLTVAVLSLTFKGLALGIDFQGGMEFVIENTGQLSTVEVREELTGVLGQQPEVKSYGQTGILVRTSAEGETTQIENQIMSTIEQSFAGVSPELVRTDIVGPRFAEDLKRGALYSVLGALFIIFVYILVRFEWRYSIGAVAALIHDVTITLGLFSLLSGVVPFSLQIDQAIIAAFLTIVGYSLNDTVVVFDRIREYANLFKTEAFDEVVNKSINTTLSRTVVTSVTTLIVVSILFIFGGEVLRGFSFALIVGVVIGTYSSVFVASPVVVELRHWEERRAVQQG